MFGTKSVALNLLADWKKAQSDVAKYKPVMNSSSRQLHVPPMGWAKINVDAVLFVNSNSIDIGSVI